VTVNQWQTAQFSTNGLPRIQGGCDALFKDDPNVFVAGTYFGIPLKAATHLPST
jgi:hypothetical protein